jgi:O-succinylbenzoic acid--CoA ligase
MAGLVAVPDDLRLPAQRRAERTAACAAAIDPAAVERAVKKALTRTDPIFAAGTARPIAGSGADAATPAVRLTTSGTTGPGTPVLLSRGALLWNAIGSAVALGQPPEERWLSGMPVSHVGGLTVLVRSAIGGTTALLRSRFDVEEQVSMLQFGEATITSVVPTMLGRLLDRGLDHPKNLRLVLLGGAPIPAELLARAEAAGIAVASTYGLSEACSQVLTRGRPLFCTQVALRSEVEAGSPELVRRPSGSSAADDPVARADELLVRGPTVALGATGPDGWLATGDRGRRLPDGGFAVTGRIAETIVTGGENVAPTEIEAQLLAQPGVVDAAALGVDHPEWGEQIEARVVLEAGRVLDESQLRDALRACLPPYAVPKRITVVEALPRTPTGKLLRRELA